MDKIAIISDLHGNIVALETVLSDIKARGIDKIIALGDLGGKGPNPDKVIDLVKEHTFVSIKGNWDYFISEDATNPHAIWTKAKIGEDRVEYLKSLPIYFDFYMSGRLVRLCHAAPYDILKRIYRWDSVEVKTSLFQAHGDIFVECDVLGYGDIHDTYFENFNNKTIFNVGSVGNALDILGASYAVIEGNYDSKEEGPFNINFIRLPYDVELEIQNARNSDMPFIDEYIVEIKTAKYRGLK